MQLAHGSLYTRDRTGKAIALAGARPASVREAFLPGRPRHPDDDVDQPALARVEPAPGIAEVAVRARQEIHPAEGECHNDPRYDQPPLDVVGCADHQALAVELAQRSITLVRNDDGLLPLTPAADARIAVVQSMPADLTPADTSSTVPPTLAAALRRRHKDVEEILLPAEPGEADITGLAQRLGRFDVIVVGTFSAHLQPAQAELAAAVLASGKRTVTIALRTPWDLLAYPSARTHVCSYGTLPPSMDALAAALIGEAPFVGRLPVAIAGLHPRGHGLATWG
jgi:beta-N-acetylhexosaminidase